MGAKVLSKALQLGRATVFLVGFAVVLALVFGFASSALGANGGNFILGKKNVATQATRLLANTPGGSLFIQNNSNAPNATALNLRVKDGKAPLRVNSDTKVRNLNADMVDGLSSEELRGQNGEKGDKGDQGEPGESVANASLDEGNEDCPDGGLSFTVDGNTTFACDGADGEDGAPGADGEDGAKGDTGERGPAGFSSLSYRNHSSTGTGDLFAYAACPSGTNAVGGGVATGANSFNIRASYPAQGGTTNDTNFHLSGTNGWFAWANNASSSQTITAYVVCAPASSVN